MRGLRRAPGEAMKNTCLCCGRTKADERKDPGPCWMRKRHVWGEWTGKVVRLRSSQKEAKP